MIQLPKLFVCSLFIVNLMAAMPAQAKPVNNSYQPLLTIGRLSSPVKLDGKLDDACWKDAALMEGFTGLDKRYPTDLTRARMAYDATYLYIAVECQQKVLDHVYQKLSEFSKKIKKRDGRVHSDDSIEIFLSADKKTYFHFIFNALGVKYDAIGEDKKWNGKWDVACRIEDGKWTAEFKIPLQGIGIQSNTGNEFSFNICRNQRADSQISSWSPVSFSFHDVDQFAKCRLGVQAVGIQTDSFFQSLAECSQISELKLSATPSTKLKQRVQLKLIPLDKKRSTKTFSKELVNGKCRFPLVLSKAGECHLQYEIAGHNGRALFRSPSYAIAPKQSVSAKVKLRSGVLSKVLLNGIEQRVDSLLLLENGVNDITLECIMAATSDACVEGELQIQPSVGTPGLQIPIDGKWQIKKKSIAENKVILSRKVAVKTSFFHPVVKNNELYIAHGTSQHAPIIIVNPTKATMQDMRIILDVPKGLEIVGIDREMRSPKKWYHRSNGRLRKVSRQKAEDVANFNRFVLNFENVEYFKGKLNWRQQIHGLVFRFTENVDKPLKLHYRIEGQNKETNLIETWNTLTVIPLKKITGKRPKEIQTVLWHGSRTGVYNPIETRALVKTFADVGFNAYIDRTSWSTPKGRPRSVWLKELQRKDFFVILELGINHFAGKLMKKHPDQHAIGFDGKPTFVGIKPEFILGGARSTFVEYIKRRMIASGANASILDLEFDPFRVCDVSESTRKEFAKFAKLKETPTPNEIKTRYRKQWVSYMCDVWRRVMEIYRDGTKAAGQDRQVWLYSSYPGEVYRKRYGIDWSLMRDIVDVAAMGYNLPSANTLKVLNGQAKLNAGVLQFEGSNPEQYRTLKTRFLRMVAQGTDGMCLFTWIVLDGRAYVLISDAIRLMADHEMFFLKGKRVKPIDARGNIPFKDLYLFEYKNKKLLLVFNDSSKTRKTKINLGGTLSVEDYYTGKKSTENVLKIQIQPYDVKAYIIR